MRQRSLAGLLLLTALLLAPFLAKPFHIDDAYQLRVARQIRAAPARPYGALYNWTGTPAPLWLNNLHPPLNAYILAGAVTALGEDEVRLHAFYLLFALGCVLWMYLLGRRMCRSPGLPALMTLASPAFFISATSVMTDIPLLFFWLLAVLLARAAGEADRPALLWPAGAAAAAAAMTNLFGLALLPLLIADWAARSRRWTPHLSALLLPALAVGLWGGYSVGEIGFFHPLAAASFAASTGRDPALSLGAAAAFLGGCFLWPAVLLPAAAAYSRRLAAAAAGLWLLLWLAMPAGTAAGGLWPPLALAGIVLLALAGESALRRADADSLLLILWLGGTVVFATGLNWTVSARSLLPAAFPAALLAVRWLEGRPRERLWTQALSWMLVPAAALTLWVAAADHAMAEAHRFLARTAARALVADGRKVSFIGHWGFQHYMEQEGAAAFDYRRPRLARDEILLVSTNNTGARRLPPPLRENVRTHMKLPVHNRYGVQTTDTAGRRAGFYSSLFGPVPFSFGRGLLHDTFLFEMRK